MLLRCAWCEATVGQSCTSDDQEVTHGICLACTQNLLDEVRREDGDGNSFHEVLCAAG